MNPRGWAAVGNPARHRVDTLWRNLILPYARSVSRRNHRPRLSPRRCRAEVNCPAKRRLMRLSTQRQARKIKPSRVGKAALARAPSRQRPFADRPVHPASCHALAFQRSPRPRRRPADGDCRRSGLLRDVAGAHRLPRFAGRHRPRTMAVRPGLPAAARPARQRRLALHVPVRRAGAARRHRPHDGAARRRGDRARRAAARDSQRSHAPAARLQRRLARRPMARARRRRRLVAGRRLAGRRRDDDGFARLPRPQRPAVAAGHGPMGRCRRN